jgi:hypothetical protein
VYKNKLIMFLRLQVLDYKLYLSHYKQAYIIIDKTLIKQTLDRNAIKGYINVIISF